MREVCMAVAGAKRLAFLGFGFQPQNVELLFETSLSHGPEVLVSAYGMSPRNVPTIALILRRQCGLESDDQLTIAPVKAWELMRDYSLLMES